MLTSPRHRTPWAFRQFRAFSSVSSDVPWVISSATSVFGDRRRGSPYNATRLGSARSQTRRVVGDIADMVESPPAAPGPAGVCHVLPRHLRPCSRGAGHHGEHGGHGGCTRGLCLLQFPARSCFWLKRLWLLPMITPFVYNFLLSRTLLFTLFIHPSIHAFIHSWIT